MPLELDGQQRRALRKALISAFPSWNDLKILVSDQFDKNLESIVGQDDLETVVFGLIDWNRARGLLGDLVIGARNQNPGNLALEEFASSVGLSSSKAGTRTLEKIVSDNNTFLDVARWRAELARSEWRVCRVDSDGSGRGTGFLVGPDLVLTNYHVVEGLLADLSAAGQWSLRFDHKLAEDGGLISEGRAVRLAVDWEVDSSPHSQVDLQADPKPHDPSDDELDFALLRLAEPVGSEPVGKGEEAEPRGWVSLSSKSVDYTEVKVVAILQHPLAKPMKLALGMEQELVLNVARNRIRHTVPTEPGSSGSPVFDSDWRLVALHHSGDPRKVKPSFNEAIPANKIVARQKVAKALPGGH